MTTQRVEQLIRRTLAEMELDSYTLSSIRVNEVPGLLCFVVSFCSRGRHPAYLYVDLHEHDEGRTLNTICQQVLEQQIPRKVHFA